MTKSKEPYLILSVPNFSETSKVASKNFWWAVGRVFRGQERKRKKKKKKKKKNVLNSHNEIEPPQLILSKDLSPSQLLKFLKLSTCTNPPHVHKQDLINFLPHNQRSIVEKEGKRGRLVV